MTFFYRDSAGTANAPIAIQSSAQNWETSEFNNGADVDLDLNDIFTASSDYQGLVEFFMAMSGILWLSNSSVNWTAAYGPFGRDL